MASREEQSEADFHPPNCSERNKTPNTTKSQTIRNNEPPEDDNENELVYCKVFYFCYSSAMGSLWPYFPLYFRQQFLTPRQVGSIVASRTLLQFLFVPFWCTIAEKFHKHKQILLIGLFAWLLSTMAIKMVPREEPKACLQMNKNIKKHTKNMKSSPVWFDFSPFVGESQNEDDIETKRQRREHEGIYDDYYSPANMFNTTEDFETIYAEYDPAKHITDSSQAFILLLLITVLGVSLASPSQTLVDICTMKQLRRSKESFGKQVVWAAIGSASFAFLIGSVVSLFKIKNPCTLEEDIDYSLCFYAFAFFMCITIMVATRFQFEKPAAEEIKSTFPHDLDESIANLWECFRTINDIHLASLLIVTFYCGFGNGFISTFLFWHLQEMGGLQILLALVSLINSAAEVIFYIVAEKLMEYIGHFRLIYIGLFCFSLRFFYYSFLRQPWLVLPIEITHGMTSAAIRSALISYIRQEGSIGHMLHGLINGIHGGLGFSIGGLVGGFMVHNYGHVLTFLIFGELSLLTLFCFILVNNIWPNTKFDLDKGELVGYGNIEMPKGTLNNNLKHHLSMDHNLTFGNMFFTNESVDHSFRNISSIMSSTINGE
eukprot:TCONS_00024217-protein